VLPGVGDGDALGFGALDAALDGAGDTPGDALTAGAALVEGVAVVVGEELADGAALAAGAADVVGAAVAVDAFCTGRGVGATQSRGWTSASPVAGSYSITRTPDSSAHDASVASSVGIRLME